MEEKDPQQPLTTENEFDYIPVSWIKNMKPREFVKIKCAECKVLFRVPKSVKTKREMYAFCNVCSKKKCLRCQIVLSKNNKCKNPMCVNPYHGQPSAEMPDFYCTDCIIYVKQ